MHSRFAGAFVLAVLLGACDDGGGGTTAGRVEIVSADIDAIDQVRVLVRRSTAPDGGAGEPAIKESLVTVSDGLLTERALVVSGSLLPAGGGAITVHAVALAGGAVVGVGGGVAPPDADKTITIVPVPAGCDLDGDTFLDCTNIAAGCCGRVDGAERRAVSDCVDDPEIPPPARPDAKQRDAAQVHPFASEPAIYALCANGLDEDCAGGDVRCPEVDGDDDGFTVADGDCDDADPLTYPGAVDGADPEDRDCDGDTGAVGGTDADADGYAADAEDPARRDCDDADPRRHPGAIEVPCNDVDEDCDGEDPCAMDDLDGDGFAVPDDCAPYDAGAYPGAPEKCGDGVDQDCDGQDLACPEGDLDRDGYAGADDCAGEDPSRFPGAPERCGDGVDQDCDGQDQACPPGADADNDGFLEPADCDNDAPRVYPGAIERCNRVDDDCDGIIDEGNPRLAADGITRQPPTCSIDLGLCSEGPLVCTASADGGTGVYVCLGVQGTEEVCDSLDNDCDGEVDNPPPGAERLPDEGLQACGPPMARGECRPGTFYCDDGALSDCLGAVEAREELCNGLDDDCDGRTDEGQAGGELTEPCFDGPAESAARGICRAGVRTCVDAEFTACVSQILPADEACNRLDDDCDGETDEIDALPCYTAGPAATEGVGVCRGGARACVDGVFGACDGQVGPTAEICDGLDNDCDGRVDGTQQSCFSGTPEQVGVGQCRAGLGVCRDGAFSECVGERAPVAETCDQLDNDCDGRSDETFDFQNDASNCGACGRACGAGEACCAGACRPLNTPANCGACGVVCGDGADACVGQGAAARCGCGAGPACEDGLRCLANGTCGCQVNSDCGGERLCCDGQCVDTSTDRCTACDAGACDAERANACGGRRCLCGDTGACPAGTQCAEAGGEFRCVGCVDNTACPGDALCCDRVCVRTRVDNQCAACGQACDLDTANRCDGADGGANRACACGDGPACRDGQVCVTDAPTAFCAQCRDDGDCGGGTPFCLDNVCRACNPEGHAGCRNNELCCGFQCVATQTNQCEGCGAACNAVNADRCTGRGCRCGNNAPCGGATPYCANGACAACRADADCGGDTPFCAAGVCVECRVGDQRGCDANELCCAQGGVPRCQQTSAAAGGQCTACDTACAVGVASQCRDRTCACGNGPACNPNGATPVCAGDRCVECLANADCNGRPGGNFCVANACVGCAPANHAGCNAQQLCCAQAGGGFSCLGVDPTRRCTACGVACDADVANACVGRTCGCGEGPACGGATPFCAAGQCVACRDAVDCGADQLCCNGQCADRGFGGGQICEACGEACDLVAADRCADGACRCGANPPCGGATPICAAGACVECRANPDCPGDRPVCDGNACRACVDGEPECAACANDDDCAESADGTFCVEGRCVPCLPSGAGCDFQTGEPICGALPTACRACEDDDECVNRVVQALIDCGNDNTCRTQTDDRVLCLTSGPLVGQCRECDFAGGQNDGCVGSSNRPICGNNYRCRGCQGDQDCVDNGYRRACRGGRCNR